MPNTLIETGAGRLAVRFLTARRWRAFLTTAGVALGVGLMAAISIMGMTLRAALADQQRSGFGTYDVVVVAEGRLLTAREVREVASGSEIRAHAGVLQIEPGDPQSEGVPLPTDYLGVGPIPEGEFAYALKEGRYPGAAEFVASPSVVARLGLKIGERTSLPFKTGERQVTLVGIRTVTGGSLGESSGALTFDLSWLQREMELSGSVDSLLIWSAETHPKEIVAEMIKVRSPEVMPVVRSETDRTANGISLMTTWATVLGLVAFFASFFLVAGTFHIAVHERLHELAMLRAIGATPEQVMRLVLQEAALLGTVGSVSGLLAGAGFSHISLGMASASFGLVSRPLVFPVLPLALEAIGGIILALAAARAPARAAGQVRPLEAMRPERQTLVQRDETEFIPGGVLMALAALLIPSGLLLAAGSGWRVLLSVSGGFAFVTGLVKSLPHLLPVVLGALALPLRQVVPVETLIAVRSAVRHRRRSAMTLTTLLLGVMLLSSVGTLLTHVTSNAERELRRRFPADAVITTPMSGDLGSALAGQIAALPGVTLTLPVAKGVSGILAYRDWNVADQAWMQQMAQQGGAVDNYKRVAVVGVDMNLYLKIFNPGEIQGDPTGGAILSAEAAQRRGIKLGDTLQFVSLAQGAEAAQGKSVTPTPLVVTALVERWMDFPENTIVVPRDTLPSPDAKIYFQYDQSERMEIMQEVRRLLDHPQFGTAALNILSEALEENRRQGMQVWVILGAVAIVIFAVATISLLTAVVAGIQARRRELATLRAVGSTPLQTLRQVILEAVLLGLAGSLLGLFAATVFMTAAYIGLADGYPDRYAWGLYVGCLAGGPLVGALAAIAPARAISRGQVSVVLRAE